MRELGIRTFRIMAIIAITLTLLVGSFSAVFAVERIGVSKEDDRHDYSADNGYEMIGTHPHNCEEEECEHSYSTDIGFPNAVTDPETGRHIMDPVIDLETGRQAIDPATGKPKYKDRTDLEYYYHQIDCLHYYDVTVSIAEIRESEDIAKELAKASFDMERSRFNGTNEFVIGEDLLIELPRSFGTRTGTETIIVIRPAVKGFVLGNRDPIDIPEYRFTFKAEVSDPDGILDAEAQGGSDDPNTGGDDAGDDTTFEEQDNCHEEGCDPAPEITQPTSSGSTGRKNKTNSSAKKNTNKRSGSSGRRSNTGTAPVNVVAEADAYVEITEAVPREEPTFVPREFSAGDDVSDGGFHVVVEEGTVSLYNSDTIISTTERPTADASEMLMTGQIKSAYARSGMNFVEKLAAGTTALALAGSIALLATIISDIKILIWYAARRR